MARVVVAGSVNMDVSVRVQRQPAAGETVFGNKLRFSPGGKGGNQAVAASRLHDEVALVAKIGADPFGQELRAFLEGERLDLSSLRRHPSLPSGAALISVDEDGENRIIVSPGSNAALAASEVLATPLASGDIALAVFEIPQETIVAFFRHARTAGARTLLNPAPYAEFQAELPALCDLLVLNESELAGLAGRRQLPRAESDCLQIMARARCFPEQTLILTRGVAGALALTAAGAWRVPGIAIAAQDATGAGDCFVGALAAALAQQQPLPVALAHANAAAALSVTRSGASAAMPTRKEMANFASRAAEKVG